VLGGLFTSTALTLLVIPALYAKFGKWLIPKQKASEATVVTSVSPAPTMATYSQPTEAE
jgi:cation efflux system protein involved in nickel and cobalt tolerance